MLNDAVRLIAAAVCSEQKKTVLTVTPDPALNCVCALLMQLENGAQMTYMQCHYAPDAERNYTFIGTKGRVENIGDYGDYVNDNRMSVRPVILVSL